MIKTLTGSNSFALRQALKAITEPFETEHGDMALERLDGEAASFERLSEAITGLPFLSTRKLVIISQGSANKQFAENASELLTDVSETTDIVIVESKLDKRSSYYKWLNKNSDYAEFGELDVAGLARWLVAEAKARDGSISSADANYLVGRVGTNQQLLDNELNKLLLAGKAITRKTIDALTEATPQSTIFELLEAAFGGNVERAMQLYEEQRALKVEPQQIIAMLTWQLHVLALIKTAGDRSADDIARQAKLSPYVVRKSMPVAGRLTLARLKHIINDLVALDRRSKRETFSVDDALQHYLLALSV